MANKTLSALLIGLMLNVTIHANEKITLEDMVKALEILIVDVKAQKEKVSLLEKEKNQMIQNELNPLKQKISSLEQESFKQTSINNDLSKKIQEVLIKGKEDHRSFLVENVSVNDEQKVLDLGLFKTTAHLKVHSEASITSPTTTYLPKGAIVKVLEEKNGVSLTEIGWVSKYYLMPMTKE